MFVVIVQEGPPMVKYIVKTIACQFPTLALALVSKVIGSGRNRRGPEIAELRQRLAQMHHVKVC